MNVYPQTAEATTGGNLMWYGATVRSWIWGAALALVMCSVNTFLTLKVGIIEEGIVVTFLIFMIGTTLFKRARPTKEEAVLVSTMGSAGGSLSFIANFYAACALAGTPLTWYQLILLPIVTSLVGFVLAIPMRQLFVVAEPLPWPNSKVAIKAFDSILDDEDSDQPRILLFFGVMALLYVLFSQGIKWFPTYSFVALFGLKAYGVGIAWSPFILGAGYLIGMRVGWGFFIGGVTLAVMAPHLPDKFTGAPHRYIWPGVMALIACGTMQLLLNLKTIIRALKSLSPKAMAEMDEKDRIMSGKNMIIVTVLALLLGTIVLQFGFNVPWYLSIIGFVVGGIVFNLIATRAYGETAFNPVRVMGVMLQGVFSWFGGSGVATNLVGAGVASGAIGQSSILVQDTHYGRHYKVPVKTQVLGQLLVLIPIAVVCAGVYYLLSQTYTVGGTALPSPIAIIWSTMAKIFAGKASYDPFAYEAMWIGGGVGVLLALVDWFAVKRIKLAAVNEGKSLWRFWPHSLGITLALILPIVYNMAFFVGAVFLCWILPKVLRTKDETLNTLAAAGIVGEGLGGLVVAILTIAGLLGK